MIQIIGPEYAEYIANHQEMYPGAMREEPGTFEKLLASGHCVGSIFLGELIGWMLFEEEEAEHHKQVYCYDLAVLKQHQREGIGKALAAAAYKNLRWQGYWIRMHCRRSSYPSPAFLFRFGYEIVFDHFIEDHYAKEYEDESLRGEHAHELLISPVGQ